MLTNTQLDESNPCPSNESVESKPLDHQARPPASISNNARVLTAAKWIMKCDFLM